MEKENLNNLEKRANELFGEKSLVSVAEIKCANKGYIVRIKMQGMPVEISAMEDTLNEAEDLACKEINKKIDEALENELFPTQPIEKYSEHELSDDQFERLYKFEELLSNEYKNNLKENTKALVCKLDDGRYECVIESPYMCLHARSTANSINNAILSATMVAHDVFMPSLIHVGKYPYKN